jgi:hypothetical protein
MGKIVDHLTDLRGDKSLCYGFSQALIDAHIHISTCWLGLKLYWMLRAVPLAMIHPAPGIMLELVLLVSLGRSAEN